MLMEKHILKQVKMLKNKKAVSAMIGYILLVAFAIVMGGIIYNWMKSYVPKESLQCPDGTSMFLTEVECANSVLDLKFKNNGRFDLAGYFIRGAKAGEEVATNDLSLKVVQRGGIKNGNAILFSQGENSLKPGETNIGKFNLSDYSAENEIKMIEIIPIRFQVVENKKQIVACSNAQVKEVFDCSAISGNSEGCTSDTDCSGTGEICNTGTGACTLCGNGQVDIDAGEECDSVPGCTSECNADTANGYTCEPGTNFCAKGS